MARFGIDSFGYSVFGNYAFVSSISGLAVFANNYGDIFLLRLNAEPFILVTREEPVAAITLTRTSPKSPIAMVRKAA